MKLKIALLAAIFSLSPLASLASTSIYLPSLGKNATGTSLGGGKYALDVAATFNELASGTDGAAKPAQSKVVAGSNGTNTYTLLTDTLGKLQVDIVSSALPTGAATAANQATANTSLSSIATSASSVDTKTPALVSGRVPVDGSGVTQPVSAASLPLPSGASTAANQTTANTSLSSIDGKLGSLGQKAMTGSAPVVIASDQSSLPVKNATDTTGTGILAGTNQAVTINTNGASTFSAGTSGTSVSTILFEATADGVTWVGLPYLSVSGSSFNTVGNLVNAGTYAIHASIAGYTQVRARMSAFTSGSVSVVITASQGARIVQPYNATASNLLVQANLFDGANSSVTKGQKTMTSSLPVTIASDQTSMPITLGSATAKTVKHAAITVGTSAVRLTTDAAAVTAGRAFLSFRSDDANTANCYWGASTVTSSGGTRGLKIFSGESVEREFDAGEYYAICDGAAQTFYVVEQE